MFFSPTLRACTRVLLPTSPSFILVSPVLLLAFALSAGTMNAQSFSGPTSYTVPENPNSGVAADFNGDGKPDLAVASVLARSVSVLLNNGDGTFSGANSYAVDFNPEPVLTADFNGDGALDLAVGNFFGGPLTAGNISILLGNGNGTFQAAVNYDAGTPSQLAVADFNGDGKLDLVATSYVTDKATVLLGNGNGTFQSAVVYSTDDGPSGVAVADLNGDGKLDLAINNIVSNNTSILLANPDGTFQAPTNIPTGFYPVDIVATDLNGDGPADLVIGAANSNAVLVLFGNGNGTFQTPANYPTGAGPQRIELADFNGDDKIDILTVDSNNASYSVLRGNGDGTFQAAVTSPAKHNSLTPIASDFNTDGKPDLAILNNGFDLVDVFLNSPSALGVNFTASQTVSATVVVATFIDYDNSKTAASFTASINWGDGPSSTGVVSANGSGGFNVTGTHTYAASGTYNVEVRIADSSGNFALATSIATVKAISTTSLSSSLNPSNFGQSVTFTATVSSTAGTPTGSVQFKDNGTNLGSPVSLSGGVATFTTSTLTAGTHAITADYGGSSSFESSSGTLAGGQVVKGITATSVSSSVNPSAFGQTVTFTATVTSGTGTPTGTVQFKDNGTNLGAPAALSGGVATFATSTLTSGTHTITAEYGGSAAFVASSGTLPGGQIVRSTTSTSLTSSLNPSTFGQAVTFTATVTSESGIPIGFVRFKDNGTNLGEPTLLGGGVATFTTSTLTPGTHTITAEYESTDTHEASSGTLPGGQVVKAITITSINTSVNPSDFTQAVTFTATVTSGSGTPTGTVQFKDNGTNVGIPVPLNASGVTTLTTSGLTVGTHTITAEYAGTATFAPSSGSLVGGQVVRTPPLLSIDDASISEGDSGTKTITFTATLTAASNLVVTANFATANGTATAGADYQAATGGLTFNPGDTTKAISVTITGDIANEVDESFFLNISNPVNAQLSRAQGTGTITNDDAPVLLTEDITGRALAFDSVTGTRDPFSLINPHNLSTDHRTRVSLFVWRLGLLPGDTVSNVNVSAQDSEGRVYQLTVEYVGAMALPNGVTQIIVRLPDNVIGAPRDLSVKAQVRGPASNAAVIKIAAP